MILSPIDRTRLAAYLDLESDPDELQRLVLSEVFPVKLLSEAERMDAWLARQRLRSLAEELLAEVPYLSDVYGKDVLTQALSEMVMTNEEGGASVRLSLLGFLNPSLAPDRYLTWITAPSDVIDYSGPFLLYLTYNPSAILMLDALNALSGRTKIKVNRLLFEPLIALARGKPQLACHRLSMVAAAIRVWPESPHPEMRRVAALWAAAFASGLCVDKLPAKALWKLEAPLRTQDEPGQMVASGEAVLRGIVVKIRDDLRFAKKPRANDVAMSEETLDDIFLSQATLLSEAGMSSVGVYTFLLAQIAYMHELAGLHLPRHPLARLLDALRPVQFGLDVAQRPVIVPEVASPLAGQLRPLRVEGLRKQPVEAAGVQIPWEALAVASELAAQLLADTSVK